MKSMQRMGGKMMKRSQDQQDVGAVIASFKATDAMLAGLTNDIKTWRDGWGDILRLQYDASEAFSTLYKPILGLGETAVDQRDEPAVTPLHTMQRCLAMQKMYAGLKAGLQHEISLISIKVMRPIEESKKATKALHKTLKHRENMKLDYERYLGKVENIRKKANIGPKEEQALFKHESDLQQAQIDYQTADEQVKQTFPPLIDAVTSLLPYILANQLMIHTTLVGQIYTSLDEYCSMQGLPNPAPADREIINAWDQQFTSFRQEVEGGLKTIAAGKASQKPMTLPDKGDSLTGLGIRNKASNLVHRDKKAPIPQPKPSFVGGYSGAGPASAPEEEEAPPPKPARPGAVGAYPSEKPMSAQHQPSYDNTYHAPYDQKASSVMPTIPAANPPPPYHEVAGDLFPPGNAFPSKLSPYANAGTDYSGGERRASAASSASSAAGKKKPPPPVPAKRRAEQAQFVVALYDFDGQNQGDLTFREGDRIRVIRRTDSTDDWWEGELNGRVGAFPANYVQT